MLRRSFLQTVTGVFAGLKSFALNKVSAARGNPTGWTITWHGLKSGTSQGYWLALPQTADRDVAFRSLVPVYGEKAEYRKRVIAMINASRNGKDLLGGGQRSEYIIGADPRITPFAEPGWKARYLKENA